LRKGFKEKRDHPNHSDVGGEREQDQSIQMGLIYGEKGKDSKKKGLIAVLSRPRGSSGKKSAV